MMAAEVRLRGSEVFFIGSHFQRCQMKVMGMILSSPTTSSLLSSNHSNSISSSSTSNSNSSSSSSSSRDKHQNDDASLANIDDAHALASFNHLLHSTAQTMDDKHKNDASSSFRNIDDVLASFNHMLHRKPLPCIVQFTKLLSAIFKMRQYYDAVISLSKQMDLAGLSPDIYTLKNLNCCSYLQHVYLGFSVLAKIITLDLQPEVVAFNTLINGLSKVGKSAQAVELFDDMVSRGFSAGASTKALAGDLLSIDDNLVLKKFLGFK